jgi:hypothetical protein
MEPCLTATAVASLEEKVLVGLAFDRSHARGHLFFVGLPALGVRQKSLDRFSFDLVIGLAFLEFPDRFRGARLDQPRPQLFEEPAR